MDAGQARHVRDVLRLGVGTAVDLFDSDGRSARGEIVAVSPAVVIRVEQVAEPAGRAIRLVVAVAVPKGNRADWMIEKLSELDAAAVIPLNSDRSIVHPESGKLERFARIAAETAKQCRRRDVLQILPGQTVRELCAGAAAYGTKWCLSTLGETRPIASRMSDMKGDVLAAIGPEGGWTDREVDGFAGAGFEAISLGQTVLRIETAAMALAAVVLSRLDAR